MQDTMYKSYEYFCMSWCECNVVYVIAVFVPVFFFFLYVQKFNEKKGTKKKKKLQLCFFMRSYLPQFILLLIIKYKD